MGAPGRLGDGNLRWVQPSWRKRNYKLVGRDGTVAQMQLKGLATAIGEVPGHKWTFEGKVMRHWTVRIRNSDSHTGVGVFKPSRGGGGTLVTLAGRAFRLTPAASGRREWIWSDGDDSLVQLEPAYDWFKATGTVLVEPRAVDAAETPLLALLGWYRILQDGGRLFDLANFIDFA